jgi:hypothetical protein
MDFDDEKKTLYQHVKHPHMPKNVNKVHKEQHQAAGFNTHVAVLLTKAVGTMPTAYLFTVLSFVGLLGLLGYLPPSVFLFCTWLSQMFLQLVFLPILSVGQNVLGKHAELLAEEQFNTTQKSYHDIEQMMAHLDAQDRKILELEQHILLLIRGMEKSRSRIVKTGMRNAKKEHVKEQITQEVEAVLTKSIRQQMGNIA